MVATAALGSAWQYGKHLLRNNNLTNARRNISSHYDLVSRLAALTHGASMLCHGASSAPGGTDTWNPATWQAAPYAVLCYSDGRVLQQHGWNLAPEWRKHLPFVMVREHVYHMVLEVFHCVVHPAVHSNINPHDRTPMRG